MRSPSYPESLLEVTAHVNAKLSPQLFSLRHQALPPILPPTMTTRSPTTSPSSVPITFTLKPRTRGLRLSATHITAQPDETQYALCHRIAQIAHLKLNRVRVTLEESNRVIDARQHHEHPPTVGDIEGENVTLLIKDLGLLSFFWR